jgi:hypothetical protein
MRRAKSAQLPRLLLYGGLALAFLLALRPPQVLSRHASAAATADQTPSEIRAMQEAVLRTYLETLPEPLPTATMAEITTVSDATLSELIDWLPSGPTQRPAALLTTSLPPTSALHTALLTATLVGRNAPTLAEGAALLPQLDLPREAPVRLTLLLALAQRAERENDLPRALDLRASAVRHPASTWRQVEELVELALTCRDTAAAIGLLEDWLETPPPSATLTQVASVHHQLAHLHLISNQPAQAWRALAPVLTTATAPLPPDTLDLAWTVATLTGNDRALVPHLENSLRQHPHHQMHWRELKDAAPPTAEYLSQLNRLATACLAAHIDPRACEALFHLAWLAPDQRIDHLSRALPLAQRLERLPELFDLLSLLPSASSPARLQLTLDLATACVEQGQTASAERLLHWQLETQPDHLPTLRLVLQLKTRGLPAMQAAQVWRRHLQQHPADAPAHHQFVEAWLAAGQPRAAINHLLATDPRYLDPDLRLRTAALALETRHQTALQIALQRLAAANEPPSPERHPELARAFQAASPAAELGH